MHNIQTMGNTQQTRSTKRKAEEIEREEFIKELKKITFDDTIEIPDEICSEILAPIPSQREPVDLTRTPSIASAAPTSTPIIYNAEPILIDSEDDEMIASINIPKADNMETNTFVSILRQGQAEAFGFSDTSKHEDNGDNSFAQTKEPSMDIGPSTAKSSIQIRCVDVEKLLTHVKNKSEAIPTTAMKESSELVEVVVSMQPIPPACENFTIEEVQTQQHGTDPSTSCEAPSNMKIMSIGELLTKINSCSKSDTETITSAPFDNKEKLQQFIQECLNEEDAKDKESIIMKLNKRFNRAGEEFQQSQELHELLAQTCEKVKIQPNSLYDCLKEVFDQLEFHRQDDTESEVEHHHRELDPPLTEEMPTEQREIFLKKLKKAYAYLGSNDDDRTDDKAYWKRYHQIHEKMLELSSDAIIKINSTFAYNGTNYKQFNFYATKIIRREGFVDHEKFLSKLMELNAQHGYGLNKDQMLEVVEKAVDEITILKKKRRTKMLELKWKNFAEFETQQGPTAEDPELLRKLNENSVAAQTRMENVLAEYAIKQKQMEQKLKEAKAAKPEQSTSAVV